MSEKTTNQTTAETEIPKKVYDKPKRKEVGAIWIREGANGKYLTGFFKVPNPNSLSSDDDKKIDFISFQNRYKENNTDRKPNYIIYQSDPPDASKRNVAKTDVKKANPANDENVKEGLDQGNQDLAEGKL